MSSANLTAARHGPSRLWLAGLFALTMIGLAVLAHRLDASAALRFIAGLRDWTSSHLPVAALAYFTFYVAFAALCLPAVWIVSVAGGALFGPWIGAPLLLAAATTGATLAMLGARYLFRDAVAARFPDLVARIDAGVAGQGARWLFAARLTPLVPYFVVNLGVGLTHMRAATFALVSFVGAAPIATLYAFAGARLAEVSKPSDIVSPSLLALMAAVGFAPLGLGALGRWRAARARRLSAR